MILYKLESKKFRQNTLLYFIYLYFLNSFLFLIVRQIREDALNRVKSLECEWKQLSSFSEKPVRVSWNGENFFLHPASLILSRCFAAAVGWSSGTAHARAGCWLFPVAVSRYCWKQWCSRNKLMLLTPSNVVSAASTPPPQDFIRARVVLLAIVDFFRQAAGQVWKRWEKARGCLLLLRILVDSWLLQMLSAAGRPSVEAILGIRWKDHLHCSIKPYSCIQKGRHSQGWYIGWERIR